MPELPKKLPAKGISILFGVSEQRISQMKRKGILKPDANNMYSVEQALQARGMQMSEHGVRVVAQTYGNGTGLIAPPKGTSTNVEIEGVLSPEDREALGIDQDVPITPSPNSVVAQTSRLTSLREQKLESELEIARTKARKLAGELVERAEVQSSFVAAGALIANILQSLPSEIAAIFADPDTKSEVRRKVDDRINQMQHALYTALKNFGEQEDAG